MADLEIRERRWPHVLPGFGQAGQTVGPFIETGNRKQCEGEKDEFSLDSTEFEQPVGESCEKSIICKNSLQIHLFHLSAPKTFFCGLVGIESYVRTYEKECEWTPPRSWGSSFVPCVSMCPADEDPAEQRYFLALASRPDTC